jgi:two-component system sensor histidine kinase LytS
MAMELLNTQFLFYWQNLPQMLQPFCMLVVAAFISIRVKRIRIALQNAKNQWQNGLIASVYFGVLAIISNHYGVLIDVRNGGQVLNWSQNLLFSLEEHQNLISYRYAMVMTAGFIAGPWVGLGAGIIAGAERYALGGSTAMFSGVSTVLLGVYGGLIHSYRPEWINTTSKIFVVAVIGTLIQGLSLIMMTTEVHLAEQIALAWELVLPMKLLTTFGCVLFFWIMRDLEQDRLQNQAREAILIAEQARVEAIAAQLNANFYKQQAELRAFQAQVEPHFLNNTLSAIQALISINPDNARAYIAKLATFFNETRECASLTSITLEQELMQVQHYMEFQQLRFQEKVVFTIAVPTDLFDYAVPPRSLQTLVENALTHGRRGITHPLEITINGEETPKTVILRVQDNGCGIAPERLALLGKQIVPSNSNGTALHQLKQSLLLVFDEQAILTVNSILQQGTIVTIEFSKEL